MSESYRSLGKAMKRLNAELQQCQRDDAAAVSKADVIAVVARYNRITEGFHHCEDGYLRIAERNMKIAGIFLCIAAVNIIIFIVLRLLR